MEVFPDLQSLSDAELKALTERKVEEEREVSYRRQLLHGHIDTLRAERASRLRAAGHVEELADVDAERLSEALTDRHTPQTPADPGIGLEPFPDIAALSDDELRALIRERTQEEADISFERRMLHGHIDLLREEVVSRLRVREGEPAGPLSADDVERLSEILKHRGPLPQLPDELSRLD